MSILKQVLTITIKFLTVIEIILQLCNMKFPGFTVQAYIFFISFSLKCQSQINMLIINFSRIPIAKILAVCKNVFY